MVSVFSSFPCVVDFIWFRFGPRESKKAMMYSDVGRLNCNVSYTTFATPVRGLVIYGVWILLYSFTSVLFLIIVSFFPRCVRDQTTKSFPQYFIKLWRGPSYWILFPRLLSMFLHWCWNLVEVSLKFYLHPYAKYCRLIDELLLLDDVQLCCVVVFVFVNILGSC